MSAPHPLTAIAESLVDALEGQTFAAPVACVYNPWVYARAPRDRYFERWGGPHPRKLLLVGMNPGPWGMAQTGVPFGEVGRVRGWLGVEGPVGRPAVEHPQRPVEGFSCGRSEVSGGRLWGWAQERWGTPEAFFAECFVHNWCPLAFMEVSGANRTPDRLRAAERAALFPPCDAALREVALYLKPALVVGVGRFAAGRVAAALEGLPVQTGQLLHPSPASPQANRGWAAQAEAELEALGFAPSWSAGA